MSLHRLNGEGYRWTTTGSRLQFTSNDSNNNTDLVTWSALQCRNSPKDFSCVSLTPSIPTHLASETTLNRIDSLKIRSGLSRRAVQSRYSYFLGDDSKLDLGALEATRREKDMATVEVLSKEIIKPSTPTFEDLKTLKLSILDHINPHVYARHAFFYPSSPSGPTNADLKASLSKLLVKYYPFAGRIDKTTINCNDEGVEFFEATTPAKLDEILKDLDIDQLAPFFPASNNVSSKEFDDKSCLVIQVTRLGCGGVIIATWFSGKAGDPYNFVRFMNDWAVLTVNPNGSLAADPEFVGASALPLPNQMAYMPAPNPEKPVFPTRRFVFEASKLQPLQAEGSDPIPADSVVIALLFKSIAGAMKSSGSRKKCMIDYVVNLRGKTNPPISENAAGSYGSHNFLSVTEEELGVGPITEKLKGAMAELQEKYSKKDTDDEWSSDMFKGFIKLIKVMLIERGEMFVFISCTGLPFYEVNFGWGNPVWVGAPSLPWKNCILFRNIKKGSTDIEAWVSLEDANVLETVASDEELLAYATINPSIPLN
ncbi:Stemmadenine O-acetyltransferase-like protein [Drosera capensis]